MNIFVVTGFNKRIPIILKLVFFFKKIFVGHMSIFGATDTPVSDFW